MTETLNIHQRISNISKAFGFIKHDAKNNGIGYTYASAAGVIYKLQQLAHEHGVTVLKVHESVEYTPKGSGKNNEAVLNMVLRFSNVDDPTDYVETVGWGQGMDFGDKAVSKAATMGYKYAVAHTFVLPWGQEDPEETSPGMETKGAKGSRKPAPLKVSLAAVKKAIAAATTVVNVEEQRPNVMALEGDDKDTAVAAFKQKKEELS